jgi:hypothetical protein
MTTCKTAATSRRLDEALSDGFPAGDPPALTEPAGDIRDVSGCCCAEKTARAEPTPKPEAKPASCCGGS